MDLRHQATVLSSHPGRATSLGASVLHTGYVQWDITGADANSDVYVLNVPPVLPGRGGYFDADLEAQYNAGQDGRAQLSMFDCTVTGGPVLLSLPAGPRSFSCSGNDAEVARTVTGHLTRFTFPYATTVSHTGTTVDFSSRPGFAGFIGRSALHSGYLEWDITGVNANSDRYHLNIPPLLPPRGGYFVADLQILFNGGIDGDLQIPMFDCVIT